MNGLSLFTGSGIGELVLKEIIPGYRTVGYVEWDKFCQRLIQARIKDGHLDDAPIWDDVRTFDGRPWAGRVDFISAGFPCQPFSVAGNRLADADERNCWPDTIRIISEIRPCYALLENVAGLLVHRYIGTVFGDLAGIGYDSEWTTISPCEIGAPHTRQRLFILSYPSSSGRETRRTDGLGATGNIGRATSGTLAHHAWMEGSPEQFGMANGVPDRLDRLRAIGNAWCPHVLARILTVRKGN